MSWWCLRVSSVFIFCGDALNDHHASLWCRGPVILAVINCRPSVLEIFMQLIWINEAAPRSALHSFWLATNLRFVAGASHAGKNLESDWTGLGPPFPKGSDTTATDLSSFPTDLVVIVLHTIGWLGTDRLLCRSINRWLSYSRHRPEWSFCHDNLAGDDEWVCRDPHC